MASLLVKMLMRAFQDVLDRKQLRGRIADKVNAKGETVIGVILEREQPTLDALATSLPTLEPPKT